MGFRYDPKDAVQCWPEGTYEATIVSVEEKQSKAGNDMLVVKFRCYSDNRQTLVTDYITDAMTWKLKKIAKACGMLAEFDTNQPNWYFDLQDKNLRVVLKVDEQDGFDDKNQVRGYEATGVASAPKPVSKAPAKGPAPNFEPVDERDIPF